MTNFITNAAMTVTADVVAKEAVPAMLAYSFVPISGFVPVSQKKTRHQTLAHNFPKC